MKSRPFAFAALVPAAVLFVTVQAGAGDLGDGSGQFDRHQTLVKASSLNRLGFFEDAEAVIRSSGFRIDSSSSGELTEEDGLARTVLARSLLGRVSGSRQADEVMRGIDAGRIAPALRGLVLFEKGRASLAAREGNEPASGWEIAGFIEGADGTDDEAEARLLYGEELLEAGEFADAATQASAAIAARPGRGKVARARLLAGRAASEPERSRLMRRLFIEMPDTVAASQTGLAVGDLSLSELRERADSFFKAYDFVEYQKVLDLLRERGDNSARLAYELARSHLTYVRDKPEEALSLLLSARERGVGNDADGTFLLGRAYAKIEDYANAEKCFREYLATGARGRKMLARYYLAWLPYDHQEYERALPAIDRFLKLYRHSDRYSYMIWFKAWSLFRLGRYLEAISVFKSMKKLGNCLVAGKAMYWGGVAFYRLHDRGQAIAWMNEVIDRYPLTWYSVLASTRLHEWYQTPRPTWMTAPAALSGDPEPLWWDESMPVDVIDVMKDVRSMAALGEPREALKLYRRVAARAERTLHGRDLARFLVTTADATEQYNALFKRSGALFGRYFGRTPSRQSGIFWMTRYPRAFRPLVSAAAGRFGIPELWVYSIMRQESRYDTRQVSYTAALGVMQMIAATARIVGEQVGVDWELDSFFEPGVNILFGTRYLSDLYREFGGQIVFASAAYNSGAPAIKRFMAANRGLGLDEMVEMIPYNEGRNYCRKVAEHLVWYGAIYLEPAERLQLYDRIFPAEVDYRFGSAVDY